MPAASSTPASSRLPIRRVVIGTAGHIDHGKSSLVRALTGVDPDRLAEEKARGMTIDLGFAVWEFAGSPTEPGQRTELVGFVDVPGHERFVKNMAAGAAGVDLALLVVAADDSVMPQTREHLEILRLMGVRRLVAALNKVDRADAMTRDLAEAEVRELLAARGYADAPVVAVSAVTGEGMDELRRTLAEAVRATGSREAGGAFRMPIQRVFSAAGSGTVVTGIPVSGSLAPGDRVEIQPGGQTARVRGVQAYGSAVDRVAAGHSSALNLADVDYRLLHRGMSVCAPGRFRASRMPTVRLELLPDARPLPRRSRVRFHTGTAERLGVLRLLDRAGLAPGEAAPAQLELDEDVVVHPGDRFVLRTEADPRTLGGGVVLEASRRRLRPRREPVLEALDRMEASLEAGPGARLEALLAAAGPVALDLAELSRDLALPEAQERRVLDQAEAAGTVVRLASPPRLVAGSVVRQTAGRVLAALEAHLAEDPLRAACPRGELLGRLADPADRVDAALDRLLKEGAVEEIAGGLRPAGRASELPTEDAAELERIAAVLRAGGVGPEDPLASAADPERARRLLRRLVEQGRVRRLGELHFDVGALEQARERVLAALAQGPLAAGELRQVLGTTRKYAIPILENLDRDGWTRRVGDKRKPGPKARG